MFDIVTSKGELIPMNTSTRRQYIKEALLKSEEPLTASYLANELSVSRQIIVGDVSILRASGLDIVATSRGYIMSSSSDTDSFLFVGMLACKHTSEQLRDELYTMVDYGGTVIDVSIEHAIYGELCGKLDLSSRHDVDLFMSKVENEKNSAPICSLTGGVHLHRIGCKDKATFELIKTNLHDKGIVID